MIILRIDTLIAVMFACAAAGFVFGWIRRGKRSK
jgi:hypothetical protein